MLSDIISIVFNECRHHLEAFKDLFLAVDFHLLLIDFVTAKTTPFGASLESMLLFVNFDFLPT